MLDWLWQPFAEFSFMRRALLGGVALALSAGPLGVFLLLRRMSLMGDAMAHGILPGTALAFYLFGLNLLALLCGGLLAGLGMALLANGISRATGLREDASLAALYPLALALGVLLLSVAGRQVDLLHLLFGSALAVDQRTLVIMLALSGLTLILLKLIYAMLVLDSLDPRFLRSVSRWGACAQPVFLCLVVLNLLVGFQAIGALMVLGLLLLPAAAARLCSVRLRVLLLLAALLGALSVWLGLLLSFYALLPSGPCIVLIAGLLFFVCLVLGSHGGLLRGRSLSMPL